jgi:hypothetical protein
MKAAPAQVQGFTELALSKKRGPLEAILGVNEDPAGSESQVRKLIVIKIQSRKRPDNLQRVFVSNFVVGRPGRMLHAKFVERIWNPVLKNRAARTAQILRYLCC